ncbi:hypothetical protein BU23DRAFT_572932 [Bimuria novae-zelandiae CBS 107.79]|uniref:Uncharacterized protein n=1 Tax=Bimuria novae-zelandiae CBS 107.79 TaxID=1447943 RepID=A0A6A5UY28_9PLEO|nr:hypothetical protein BU23DRAFT_572932 [Bimuria novae-zelandiae CBS 107.79]
MTDLNYIHPTDFDEMEKAKQAVQFCHAKRQNADARLRSIRDQIRALQLQEKVVIGEQRTWKDVSPLLQFAMVQISPHQATEQSTIPGTKPCSCSGAGVFLGPRAGEVPSVLISFRLIIYVLSASLPRAWERDLCSKMKIATAEITNEGHVVHFLDGFRKVHSAIALVKSTITLKIRLPRERPMKATVSLQKLYESSPHNHPELEADVSGFDKRNRLWKQWDEVMAVAEEIEET